MKTCCIISQPLQNFPFGFNEEETLCTLFKEKLYKQAEVLISEHGVTHFLCDLTIGIPLYAAEILLIMKDIFPELTLECVLPYETQAETWSEDFRDRYFRAVEKSDKETLLQTRYTLGCERTCTRCMIDRSDVVLAAFAEPDIQPDELLYARETGKQVVSLDV